VRGFNDTPEALEAVDNIAAVSSCSTNCIATILRVVDGALNVKWATANIVHARTNSQRVLDGRGNDLVGSRNIDNILPASTGSSREIRRFFPDILFHSNSFRVPVEDGSLAVITAEVAGAITEADVVELLQTATTQPDLENIIGLKDGDMFSRRVIGDSHSSIVDLSRIIAREFSGRTTIELQAWFDNEWGYSNRVAEIARLLGQLTV
jgi:glyceraldehyde 3-phosphate dehydrogenase